MDERSFKKLPRSSTKDNFKSKNDESNDSDSELNKTKDKLDSTYLSSDDGVSDNKIDRC